MGGSKEEKMRQQAAAKKIEDKTFGMKNKNKCARRRRLPERSSPTLARAAHTC
jgi:hypothetical protein